MNEQPLTRYYTENRIKLCQRSKGKSGEYFVRGRGQHECDNILLMVMEFSDTEGRGLSGFLPGADWNVYMEIPETIMSGLNIRTVKILFWRLK